MANDTNVTIWWISVSYQPPAVAWRILSDSEKARADRFVDAWAQSRYVFAHAALRIVAAEATGIHSASVPMGTDANGKPCLINEASGLIDFNISKSGEFVAVAISNIGPIGIDIEKKVVMKRANELASRILSPKEYQAYLSTDAKQKSDYLLQCWVGKEAVVKATGEGIHDTFTNVRAWPRPCAVFDYTSAGAEERTWCVQSIAAPKGYVGACCTMGRAPKEIRTRIVNGIDFQRKQETVFI